MENRLTLVGLDIEGEWNFPLLANAAEISGASLLFANTRSREEGDIREANSFPLIDDLSHQFDGIIACETSKQSKPIFDFPTPRGHLAILVGNEQQGIPHQILNKADHLISIPMQGRGLSSINVAVAAAIVLYALQHDLGRRRKRKSSIPQSEVDLFLLGPEDPSEIGSLLRNAWAFGWQRVFLADPKGVWFSKDRSFVLKSRAAARCEVNRIAVCPQKQLAIDDYDHIIHCTTDRYGKPLSRFAFPDRGRVLIVYGDGELPFDRVASTEQVYLEHTARETLPCFRHGGSIFLSVFSQQIRRNRRG